MSKGTDIRWATSEVKRRAEHERIFGPKTCTLPLCENPALPGKRYCEEHAYTGQG